MNNNELSKRVAELIGVETHDNKTWDGSEYTAWWKVPDDIDWRLGSFNIETAEAQMAFIEKCCDGAVWINGKWWLMIKSYKPVVDVVLLEAIRAVVTEIDNE